MAPEETLTYKFVFPSDDQPRHLVKIILRMVLSGPEGPCQMGNRDRLHTTETIAGKQNAAWREPGYLVIMAHEAVKYGRFALVHRVAQPFRG